MQWTDVLCALWMCSKSKAQNRATYWCAAHVLWSRGTAQRRSHASTGPGYSKRYQHLPEKGCCAWCWERSSDNSFVLSPGKVSVADQNHHTQHACRTLTTRPGRATLARCEHACHVVATRNRPTGIMHSLKPVTITVHNCTHTLH